MTEEERTIFERLMAERETGESMSFLLRLAEGDKRSFLVYAQGLNSIESQQTFQQSYYIVLQGVPH